MPWGGKAISFHKNVDLTTTWEKRYLLLKMYVVCTIFPKDKHRLRTGCCSNKESYSNLLLGKKKLSNEENTKP